MVLRWRSTLPKGHLCSGSRKEAARSLDPGLAEAVSLCRLEVGCETLPLGLLPHTAEYDGFPFALIEAMSMDPFRTASVASEFPLRVHLSSRD
jgi:hypothetical protein